MNGEQRHMSEIDPDTSDARTDDTQTDMQISTQTDAHSTDISVSDVHIDDIAPKRTRDFGDFTRAILALGLAAIVMVCAVYLGGFTRGVEADAHTAAQAINWMADIPATALQQLVTIVIVVSVIGQLLVAREWLTTVTAVLTMFAGYGAVWAVSSLITNLDDATLALALISAATSFSAGLLPNIYAAMAAFLTVAGPRRTRSTVKWGWNILYATAALMVVLSWHSVTGMLISLTIGRTLGMIIRFCVGTQNAGVWGADLIATLRGIGLDAVSLVRQQDPPVGVRSFNVSLDDDLVEGSRIYRLLTADGHQYVVSVLDAQTHTAGYLKQVWNWMRLSGVSMRRDRSVRDAVQHHCAMLLGLRSLGLPSPAPFGIADTDGSAVLVLDATTTAFPANLNTLTRQDAIDYMCFLDTANRRGYTHRRITPNTLARLEDGTALIAGWQNGDNFSASTNAALDKVQLLALFAALIGTDESIAAARQAWGDDTLTSLVPFLQKVAIPAPTRTLTAWNKQLLTALRSAIGALVDEEQAEPMETVELARFSWRSMLAMLLVIVAVVVVFTQLKPEEIIAAVRNANPTMAVISLALGMFSWIGSSISLGALMDKAKRNPLALFMSQVAGGFATVSMPAGVGPAFVNLQFLRKSGYRNTLATALLSAMLAVYYVTYFALLVLIGLFTGRNMLSGMIPTNTLVIAIAAAVGVAASAMMIPPLRRLITKRLVPLAKSYVIQLLDVLSRPKELVISIAGALLQNFTLGLAFWTSLLAFGVHTNLIETMFVFLLANAIGSSVPTPGGLGGVEAAVTFAFVAVGVPQGVALSATLLHRVVFYWLRIPLGALAMRWLDAHSLV